jgi:hypothetical protein
MLCRRPNCTAASHLCHWHCPCLQELNHILAQRDLLLLASPDGLPSAGIVGAGLIGSGWLPLGLASVAACTTEGWLAHLHATERAGHALYRLEGNESYIEYGIHSLLET